MKKIVLVDDEQNVLDSIARTLSGNDYEIIKFVNPTEALDYLKEYGDEIDLLISDNKMPDQKGQNS